MAERKMYTPLTPSIRIAPSRILASSPEIGHSHSRIKKPSIPSLGISKELPRLRPSPIELRGGTKAVRKSKFSSETSAINTPMIRNTTSVGVYTEYRPFSKVKKNEFIRRPEIKQSPIQGRVIFDNTKPNSHGTIYVRPPITGTEKPVQINHIQTDHIKKPTPFKPVENQNLHRQKLMTKPYESPTRKFIKYGQTSPETALHSKKTQIKPENVLGNIPEEKKNAILSAQQKQIEQTRVALAKVYGIQTANRMVDTAIQKKEINQSISERKQPEKKLNIEPLVKKTLSPATSEKTASKKPQTKQILTMQKDDKLPRPSLTKYEFIIDRFKTDERVSWAYTKIDGWVNRRPTQKNRNIFDDRAVGKMLIRAGLPTHTKSDVVREPRPDWTRMIPLFGLLHSGISQSMYELRNKVYRYFHDTPAITKGVESSGEMAPPNLVALAHDPRPFPQAP